MSTRPPELFLLSPFQNEWRDKDVFSEVQKISKAAQQQNIFREKEGRRTSRFLFKGEDNNPGSYFLKYHAGTGWIEILKNLIQLRLPVVGASNEYRAAIKLKELELETLTPVAYGSRGKNPARQESFLITKDLIGTVSLEDYCRNWKASPPSFPVKKALIKKVATVAKRMHENGINHRDFYICHFLLDEKGFQEATQCKNDSFNCYLIDLHRCQLRQRVPYRWLVKDLGGLLYSTMDAGLSVRDYFRFIKIYTGKPLRAVLQDTIWSNVLDNAKKLYLKDFKKPAPALFKADQ